MKKITLVFLFLGTHCFSQSYVQGYVYDKSTSDPIPYATIRLKGTNYYSVTNEDGNFRFKIKEELQVDSLEVQSYGFDTKVIPTSYFLQNEKLSLTPSVSSLNEVYISSNNRGTTNFSKRDLKKALKEEKNYMADLLFSVIEKYRSKQARTESKVLMSLTSSSLNTPIEQIEGFYNASQSLSKGIVDLKLKSGRFGQNKSFSFYSLKNSFILKDFKLFKNALQLLPSYPGNMSLSGIKGKYNLEFENCTSCQSEDVKIRFTPKKPDQHFFYGFIIFDAEELIIRKITLEIKNPITSQLDAIVPGHTISPKEISLKINFNPLDYNKIQSYDFKFSLYYGTDNSMRIINSNSFLYFYDYDNIFELPLFINPIEFKNDYDQIIAQQASEEFWELNYQYPKSYKETKSMDFMKGHGFLINYSNDIPVDYLRYTEPSVIAWNKYKRLDWQSINQQEDVSSNDQVNSKSFYFSGKVYTNITFQSNSDIKHGTNQNGEQQKVNFSYVLDFNDVEVVSRTIFNRGSSYYSGIESDYKLIYFNIAFDIYEYYRQNVENSNNENVSFDNFKIIYLDAFKEASELIKLMKKETNYGEDFHKLISWNNRIAKLTNIDNYAYFSAN